MNSLILRTATRTLVTLLLLLSLFLLVRGHNEPGGGFIGGLIAAAAFGLVALALGPGAARHMLRVDGRTLIGAGIALALASTFLAVIQGMPILTGLWTTVEFAGRDLGLGTPLLFDIGVYLVVVGSVVTMILALEED
jgi:multisubunit Na+/H+ antiporter MnhB subunit